MNVSPYRSGLTIDLQQARQIESLLQDLRVALPANLLLLADTTGDVVSVHGSDDPALIIPLASLVAGDLATSQEMARLTTAQNPSAIIFREGQAFNSFVLQVDQYFVLYAQIDCDTPLNWARVLLQQSIQKIVAIMQTPALQTQEYPQLNISEIDTALDALFMD
jgi:hypothetical protein